MAYTVKLNVNGGASQLMLHIPGVNNTWDGGSSPTATPWLSATYTPIRIANNPVTGQAWTPTAAKPVRSYAPSAHGGGNLAVTELQYDLVEDVIPIQIRATTVTHRQKVLGAIRALLNSGLAQQNCILSISDGVSTTAYFEVIDGDVQEDPVSTFGSENDSTTLRAKLTLIRRPFSGIFASIDAITVANATTLTNTQGSNTASMTVSEGELIYEGQPMQVQVTPVSSATAGRVYLATVLGVETDTSGWSATGPLTSSYATVGTATFTGTQLAKLLKQYPVRARLFVRFATISGAAIQAKADLSLTSSGSTYYTADVSGTTIGTTSTGRFVDFGEIPIPLTPGVSISGSPDLRVNVQAAGSGATVTVGYVQVILYYDFALITGLALTSSQSLGIVGFPFDDGTGTTQLALPLDQPLAHQYNGAQSRGRVPLYGDAPLCRTGTSLWLIACLTDAWAAEQNTSHQFTLSAYYAPLYRSLAW